MRFHSKQKLLKRQYSVGEGLKDFKKEQNHSTRISSRRRSSLQDPETIKIAERCDTERILRQLSLVNAEELLSQSPPVHGRINSAREIKGLENAYKNVMEKFLFKMAKFLQCIRDMRNEMLKSLREFRSISRRTAQATLATSATQVALVIGGLAQKYFDFSWNLNISRISTVIGVLSFTGSLLAVTHMKHKTTEISKNVRRANLLLEELMTAHRKGNWIDEKVTRLFPYGINVNNFDKRSLEDRSYFEDKHAWRKYFCSVIILSNIQKDSKLLYDEEFQSNVKLFMESAAAEIWWNRIKVKRLLEKIQQKANRISSKEFISGHEDYIQRTTMYTYPVVLPWLVTSWNSEEIRFLCSTIAGIIALTGLGNDESEELQKLKEISRSFEKDCKEINKICEILEY